jgi:hypothetical protein
MTKSVARPLVQLGASLNGQVDALRHTFLSFVSASLISSSRLGRLTSFVIPTSHA